MRLSIVVRQKEEFARRFIGLLCCVMLVSDGYLLSMWQCLNLSLYSSLSLALIISSDRHSRTSVSSALRLELSCCLIGNVIAYSLPIVLSCSAQSQSELLQSPVDTSSVVMWVTWRRDVTAITLMRIAIAAIASWHVRVWNGVSITDQITWRHGFVIIIIATWEVHSSLTNGHSAHCALAALLEAIRYAQLLAVNK